jgi:hypothetical protein
VSKEARSVWEKRLHERNASSGGWCASGGADGSGEWLVASHGELWREGEALCKAIEPSHPRGALPLVDASVQPAGTAEAPAIDLSCNGHEMTLLCTSVVEREAWLGALRAARDLSAHRMYMVEVAKGIAEESRDEARRERDALQRVADGLREEASAEAAAAQRARAQISALGSQQEQAGVAIADREEQARLDLT